MKRQPVYSGPYRVHPQPALDFSGELIVDLFAGGGGASTGIEWALGRSPDVAVNHNLKSVLMHQINHPHTKHYCESVFDVVPQEVCAGRPVGYLWMSPDCTHFSKAKGSKPVSKRVRGLAWVGKRWAATVRPRVIFLENVEEFTTWGPLVRINGEYHPCKKRSGRTFRTFVRELQRLGYQVEWRTLRACDYGAPTIRRRLFLVARCDGQPIEWPEVTHADPKTHEVKSGILKPWRTAAECIDWSHPCPSIFDRKKPLAENTLRRIARGIQRYVIDNPEPFIVPFTCGVGGRAGQSRPRSVKEPFQTITTKADTVVVAPSLTEHANGSNQRIFAADEPLRTQCAQIKGGHFALQTATLVGAGGPAFGGKPVAVDQPVGTLTTENHRAIASAMLLKHYGGVVGTPLDVPVGTITTADHHAIGAATLIQTGYGERQGQAPRVPHLDKPLGTLMAGGVKHAVTTAHMVRHFGESVGSAANEPVGTITAGGQGKTGLVAASLVRNMGMSMAVDITDPAPTQVSKQHDSLVAASLVRNFGTSNGADCSLPHLTITGKQKDALATSSLVKLRGTCKDGQRTDAPLPTITAGGTHVAEVRAFLLKYYGADQDPRLEEPLHTVTTKHRFGLVTVKGEVYQIADIGMRMLKPRELYRAQGFPDDYVIDYVLEKGKKVPLTVTDQVRFCGNSVSPYNAAALVRANAFGNLAVTGGRMVAA